AAIAGGIGAIVGLIVLAVTYTVGISQQSNLFQEAQQTLANAGWLHQRWRDLAAREHQKQHQVFETRHAEFEAQREQALDRYQRAYAERRGELEQTRTRGLQEANVRFAAQQQSIRALRDERTQRIDAEFAVQRQALEI